ncbi:MAG TPA: threonine/serine exporter family protein [Anaerolineaceae bacterium]|nr:threonine/serine exporter family protein [Anaerolineaceae bacterium]
MNISAILINSLWAGLFGGSMGILLTVPLRFVAPTFLCGFTGRLVRDTFMSWGLSQNLSTVVAAAVVLLVAVSIIRQDEVSPVALVCAVLPLGAAVAMFNVIASLMKVSFLEGEALSGASVVLTANTGKVFTTSLAIALGLGAGFAIVRLFRRDDI